MLKDDLYSMPKKEFKEEVPALEHVYVIPTRKKYYSGWKTFHVFGTAGDYERCLSDECDVVEFIGDVRCDSSEYPVLHYWARGKKLKPVYIGGSVEFEVVEE